MNSEREMSINKKIRANMINVTNPASTVSLPLCRWRLPEVGIVFIIKVLTRRLRRVTPGDSLMRKRFFFLLTVG